MIFFCFNLVPSVRVSCMTIIHQSNALETDWQKVEWSKSHWLSRGLYVWVCRWLVDCFVKGCVCVCYLCVLVLTHVPRRSGRASRLSAVSKLTSLPPTPRDRQYPQTNRAHVTVWQLLGALLFSIQVNLVPFPHLCFLFLVNSASHFMLAKQYHQWKCFYGSGEGYFATIWNG